MIKLSDENYELAFDEAANIVKLNGVLRLNGVAEYQPITDFLMKACDAGGQMTLNLQGLEFLNSSGIATFSKFILHARGCDGLKLNVVGSKSIPWQGKSLVNLRRLMPALELELI